MTKTKVHTPRIVVITGSSSGIGKYLADYFTKKGDTVIGLCRTPSDKSIRCDISDITSINDAVDCIRRSHSKVDILINNAGYGITGACECMADEQIKKIFDVDLMGAIYLTKRILPLMTKGGKIINISSACALFAVPFRTMYCSSKAALSMWSDGLKMELYPSGIDVTAICPGDVKTPFTVNRLADYSTNERYNDAMIRADKKVENGYDKRMSLEKVGSAIAKIIEKRSLKPLYIIGAKYKFFYFAKKFMPYSWFMRVTNKVMLPKK